MPYISQLRSENGNLYDIKDTEARRMIADGISLYLCKNASDTPYGVTWVDNGVIITGTLQPSADTKGKLYLVPTVTQDDKDVFSEYVTLQDESTYSWEKFGTTDIVLSNLGTLAYKNSASGSYTPEGSVSAPEITVSPTKVTKYVASSQNGGGSVQQGSPASCTFPTVAMTVENEIASFGLSGGSFTPNVPTAVTLPQFESQDIVTGASASATQPNFTGTPKNVTVT